jgi:hypothetical protein
MLQGRRNLLTALRGLTLGVMLTALPVTGWTQEAVRLGCEGTLSWWEKRIVDQEYVT